MKPVFIVKYKVDNEKLTDEQFENQDERQLIITEQMIIDIIEKSDRNFQHGDFVDFDYVAISKS